MRWRGARRRWPAALQRDPDDQALAALGEWYAFRGIYDRAAELLGRSLAHGGPTPRLLLGRCYLETDPARAAAEFPWTDHLSGRGQASPAGVGAAVRMAKSLPERPVSAFSMLLFGEYLLLGGEPTKAAECLAAAVAQEPHPVHRKSLGWACSLAGGARRAGRSSERRWWRTGRRGRPPGLT